MTVKPVEPDDSGGRYNPELVRRLFDDMAATYHRVNVLSSFGFCVRWRRQVVGGLPLATARHVVDLMSGMGELWPFLARQLCREAQVTGIEFSTGMASRTPLQWPFQAQVRLADVLEWKPDVPAADIVVCSYGIKTLSLAQQDLLAARIATLLRPGGEFAVVEISVPPSRLLRATYMFYLRRLIPLIGKLLLGNPESYRMLGIYTAAFGDCSHFADCLRRHGLEARMVRYFFGCATGVRGFRPLVA